MEFLMDPSIWVGLATLIVLEIVLGIDNLVFIAIMAERLPPHQRDKARKLGLSLALVMRLGLLFAVSWLVSLTQPLFAVGSADFSGRDLILLLGGVFLVFKATTELHERMEGAEQESGKRKGYASFWMVVAQILLLDAVFSLDSVITAVGMVDQLWVMMVAVIISMGVMIFAAKPLTAFVNEHPTVVILCLGFLLMIGFSLMVEGFGFHIPKEYLYAAIGFSIMIETFNQLAFRNRAREENRTPMRERTAEAIMRLLGGRADKDDEGVQTTGGAISEGEAEQGFGEDERFMMSGVLKLGDRSIRTVMTPRADVSWIDCEASPDEIRHKLMSTPHSLFPVCKGSLDEVLGVVRAKELLTSRERGESLATAAEKHPPIVVPDSLDVLRTLGVLRKAKGSLVMVVDEFGVIQGLVTPLDILEAIAGEFPDADETPDIEQTNEGWTAKGSTVLHYLEQVLPGTNLTSPTDEYLTLAGLLLAQRESFPEQGESFKFGEYVFEIKEMASRKIERVNIRKTEEASNPERED